MIQSDQLQTSRFDAVAVFTHNVETEDLDTIVGLAKSGFFLRVKLLSLIYAKKAFGQPKCSLPIYICRRLTNEFATCLAAHGEGRHQSHDLLSIFVDLFPGDLRGIEIYGPAV